MMSSVLWNLFLAAIPVGLAHALTATTRQMRAHPHPLWRLWLLFLGISWLAWLPNTIYLLTQWRHWLEIVDLRNLAIGAYRQPSLYFEIYLWGVAFFFYSLCGVLTLVGAVRPIEELLRRHRIAPWVWAPPLFLLVSIGVYLGLILRFNSWDLATRPGSILLAIAAIFGRPVLFGTVLSFALAQWAIYEAADLWLEAFQGRWRAWRGASSA